MMAALNGGCIRGGCALHHGPVSPVVFFERRYLADVCDDTVQQQRRHDQQPPTPTAGGMIRDFPVAVVMVTAALVTVSWQDGYVFAKKCQLFCYLILFLIKISKTTLRLSYWLDCDQH